MKNILRWVWPPFAGWLVMLAIAEALQPPDLIGAVMGGVGVGAGILVAGALINRRELREHEGAMRSHEASH